MHTSAESQRERPERYGVWWNNNALGESWYTEIYSHRVKAYEFFMNWFTELIRRGERIDSTLEVGCGRGLPFARIFADHNYHGADISEKEIAFCRAQYGGGEDRFRLVDAIKDDLGGPYDLVFSHAVIDHVYDINAYLQQLAKASNGFIYHSAYRGWHPRLDAHKYTWNEHVTCYDNYVSPSEARRTLNVIGADKIEIFPIFVGNVADDLPLETVICARVGSRD
jgi:hypothetical protein